MLFREDWIMTLSLIPLLIRMGLVHVVLLYGTNNVVSTSLSAEEIRRREIGSRLVLASRIFYAMFIWVSKWTVSEFLKRNFSNIWKKSYERTLHGIRLFLIFTFIAVVIATLSECQPFDHYWQVVPDPGAQCRQGFAQLLTMGTADIITDLLLIAFPIPVILSSHMNWKRKFDLVALFSLSVILIVITGFRMPEVISHLGRQQYRTVWASSEILASAAVANAIVLGSFIRDRGVKRRKYRHGSYSDSIERAPTRRPTMTTLVNDSDEELFRGIGCRMPTELHEPDIEGLPISEPEPVAQTPTMKRSDASWHKPPSYDSADQHRTDSTLEKEQNGVAASVPPPLIHNEMSFTDAGGLLSNEPGARPSRAGSEHSSGTVAHDFALTPIRSGDSRALSSDLGGVGSSPLYPRQTRRPSQIRFGSGTRAGPSSPLNRITSRQQSVRPEPGSMDLKDIGGLLR